MTRHAVSIHWARGDEDLVVECQVTGGLPAYIGSDPSSSHAPEAPDVDVLEVYEDATGNVRRDLLKEAEASADVYYAACEAAGEAP